MKWTKTKWNAGLMTNSIIFGKLMTPSADKTFTMNRNSTSYFLKGYAMNCSPTSSLSEEWKTYTEAPKAKEIFLEGEGMSPPQKRANYERARDEAGRERAIRDLTVENRLGSVIESLDNLTSVQLAEISPSLRARLEEALQRIIAQATISTDETNETSETE